ncbi:MAG: restriction endonuclease subunit S [Methylococcaceae bacterium]
MKWERKTLGELVKAYGGRIQSGPFGSQLHRHDYKSEGIPVVMPKDIINDRVDTSSIARINDNDADRLSKHKLNIGDLVLPRRGDINKRVICKQENEGWLCGTGCLKIRLNDDIVDPNYLYYYFTLAHVVEAILNKAVGSTMLNLSGGILSSTELVYPPLPTQRKIASILSAYDDLIENNLKRIKLLEEQAFLKYKGIVTSEKLKTVQLKDVAVVNESTLKTNSNIDKLLYVDIASVSTGSIDNKTEYDLKEAPGRAKRILKHEDIIWSCVRPNRKSYAFVWKPEDNLIASTGFAVITSKEIPATFLYQLTIANEFVSYLENHAKGATYPAVTATDFAEALINIPSDSIMKEYHEAVYPCFELKNILQKQNAKLREARDILLPKLMNGQIAV